MRASWHSHLLDVEVPFSICNQCWHQHLWDCFKSIWVSPLHTLISFMFSFICNSSTFFTFLIDFFMTPIHISFLLLSSLSFHFYTCFQFVFFDILPLLFYVLNWWWWLQFLFFLCSIYNTFYSYFFLCFFIAFYNISSLIWNLIQILH
jgi:hypothetical protein